MQRTIIVSVILLATVLGAQAATTTTDSAKLLNNDAPIVVAKRHARTSQSPASGVVTYNRDSVDPNVGWHWQGGMRVCHQDCDNPEIPGSGYTCRNVQVLGMAMRECDSRN
jgi:hypothetical protein